MNLFLIFALILLYGKINVSEIENVYYISIYYILNNSGDNYVKHREFVHWIICFRYLKNWIQVIFMMIFGYLRFILFI